MRVARERSASLVHDPRAETDARSMIEAITARKYGFIAANVRLRRFSYTGTNLA